MIITQQSLNTCSWYVRTPHFPEAIPAAVPGSLFQAVHDAELLPDPFAGQNDTEYRRLAESGCIFSCTFTHTAATSDTPDYFITFDALDTICEIYLNGSKLGAAQNMHRPHRFQVNDALKEGENQLELRFSSPVAYLEEREKVSRLWNPPHGLPGIGHLRKAYFMSGWDWGPILPDMGPSGPIILTAEEGADLDSVYIRQIHAKNRTILHLDWELSGFPQDADRISAAVRDPHGSLIFETDSGIHNTRGRLSGVIENPQLWWPNGMGDQPMYSVQIIYHSSTGSSVQSYSIGLRTIRLNTSPDEWGSSFTFEINGIPMFMKGANYVPQDNLVTRITPERITRLLEDCRSAHHNMVRIWGGGIYPDAHFYEECSRLGLLVWQDFMIACAVTELTPDFELEMSLEAEYQIKRLRNHTSLALWCGNNEMESAWHHWDIHRTERLEKHYTTLFEILLPRAAAAHDPDRNYWPSSPSSFGGIIDPDSPDHGDVHDWKVWHGREPLTWFSRQYHRFLSEFGMQSFPSMATIRQFAPPEEHSLHSPSMDHHQKNDDGNNLIHHYVREYIGDIEGFRDLVFASQIMQAEGIGEAIRHFRLNSPRCMGTIYWQLNDSWPGPSWSSIDYYGWWKPLHYISQRVFAPVLTDCRYDDGRIHPTFLADPGNAGTYTIRMQFVRSDGKILGEKKISDISAQQDRIMITPLEAFTPPEGFDPSTTVCILSVTGENGYSWRHTKLFCSPKEFSWEPPQVTSEISAAPNGGSHLRIRTAALVHGAWIEIDGTPLPAGTRNFLTLIPSEETVIDIPAGYGAEAAVTVQSLNSLVTGIQD